MTTTTPDCDDFAGMTPEDEARARAYRDSQEAIARKRREAAQALLPASQAPAQEVREAWAPRRSRC